MLARRIFAASSGKLFWDLLSRSMSFVFSIIVARSLGAHGFGTFAVAWYVVWMLSQATDLGLHVVALRALSHRWRARVLTSAVATKAVLTGLVLVVFGLFVSAERLLQTDSLGVPPATLFLLLAAALFGSWTEIFGVALRSRGRIGLEGMALSLARAGWLLGAVIVLAREGDLASLALGLAIGSLPALFLAVICLRSLPTETWAPPSALVGRALVAQSLPLAVTAVITLLYLRADLMVVALYRGATEAGIFASAYRLFEATFVFSGGIVAGAFPLLAARYARAGFETMCLFVLRLLLGLGLPAAAGIAMLATPITTLVYGDEFSAAAGPMAVLAVALIPVFANALSTHLLILQGETRFLAGSMLARLSLGLATSVVLVPTYGAVGAAAAVIVGETGLTLLSFVKARPLLPARRLARVVVAPGVATLVMVGALWRFPATLPLSVVVGMAVYCAVFYATMRLQSHRGECSLTWAQPCIDSRTG